MLPLFALALPLLVLLCGFVIDVELMQNQALAMQNAADAASLGAELEQERNQPDFIQVGQAVAALNGFANGSAQTLVSVAQQPATGAFAGHFDALEVRITRPVHTLFLQYFTNPALSIRAVALIPPCIVLTGPASGSGTPALSATSSTISPSCPVYANGTASADSNSSLSATAWNLTGASGSLSGGAPVSPAPRFNASTLPDPLAQLPQPTASSCSQTNFLQNGGSVTLYPGTYCGGLTLKNTSATFTPGLYTITGGAHWSNSQVQAAGITLFLTQGGGSSFGQFVVDGNSSLTLSAPVDTSAGALPGILLFADRQWSPTTPFDLQITNSTVQADGVLYTTNTGLQLTGTTLAPARYLALDLATLSLASSQLSASGNFSSVTTGSPFRPIGGNVE